MKQNNVLAEILHARHQTCLKKEIGTPKGNRTPVYAVRGRRPDR